MQKTILKLWVKGRIRPLIVADIVDEENKIIDELFERLNSKDKVIKFGRMVFRSDDFKRYTLTYK